MYDRILVPTDGGPNARRIADEAEGIAAMADATVHALYVIDVGTAGGLGAVEAREATAGALRETGQNAVEALARWIDDVPVETAVRRGTPSQEILAYADEIDADLVVMGTHGRTGVGRLLLGSVAERVVRESEIPVTTVDVGSVEPAIDSEEAAEETAAEALAEEGEELDGLREQPYREASTWVVPARTAAGEPVNVHVDAATGDARVAHLD